MNGANAAKGTVERSDYDELMQRDEREQLQDYVQQAVRLQRVWLDFMAAGMRMFFSAWQHQQQQAEEDWVPDDRAARSKSSRSS